MHTFSASASGPAVGLVRRIEDRLRNKAPFYAASSELALSQTQQRFSEQRSPDGTPWTPNKPATLGKKKGTVILQDSGALRGGVYAAPAASMAVVNPPPLAYAGIHQRGGRAGRNHAVVLPSRPYLGFSDRDAREHAELYGEVLGVL